MPRILFSVWDDMAQWLERFGDAHKFTVYCTAVKELIFEPLRSTEPRRWAYLRCRDNAELNQVRTKLTGLGYCVLNCQRYDWASDRAVEAHGPQGEDEI